MPGLCYWCESRGIMQCKDCTRSFCKFCIKNGHSQDESKRVCFICGCFEITETTNITEVITDNNISCLRDREMQDMLHRYENLCSNDKLSKSMRDLLMNIDDLTAEKLPIFFEVMKSNILSMLHDIQKVETMINRASQDNRLIDIDKVLMPLLKVVTKHHVFKKLGRPQIVSDNQSDDISHCENGNKSIDNSDLVEKDYIDLTDEERMMDLSRNVSEDGDDERMQRSPLRLADEEKTTMNFEIKELKDDDDDVDDINEFVRISRDPAQNLSLISSQIEDLSQNSNPKVSIKDSPKVHEFVEGLFESVPAVSYEKTMSRKRRTRQLSDVEKRSVRLRSETVCCNNSESRSGPLELRTNSFSGSVNVYTSNNNNNEIDQSNRIINSPLLRSSSRKTIDSKQQQSSASSLLPFKKQDKQPITKARRTIPDETCKQEIHFECPSGATNKSSSSSSECCNALENLNKFSKILQRNKNSHLVCPSPISYEKPFLLKEMKQIDQIDDKPVANKTWSWERQVPTLISKSKTITNGDISKILCKPIVIPKSILEAGSSVAPVRGRPRLSAIEPLQNKRTSPSTSFTMDLEEPKKKRGRPRKYFNNYMPDFNMSCQSITTREEDSIQDSSNVSNTK